MGTNTFRLLIAEMAEIKGRVCLKPLYSENRIVRLGEGFSEKKIIRPAAIARALNALQAFRNVTEQEAITSVIVTGTSAIREAENQEAFLSLIKEKCGLKIEILSGQEEARLTLTGVKLVFPEAEKENDSTVVIDIGGGSTELIRSKRGQNPFLLSLGLGAVTLSEKYLHGDPPTSVEIKQLKAEIDLTLSNIAHHFPKDCRFAGTAGTVTTLAAIDQLMTHYDPDKINHYQMTQAQIAGILETLCALPKEKRKNLPGLEKGREDIIIAGTLVLLNVMERFSYDLLHVSDYGLREGVLMDQFGNQDAS